MANIVSYEAKAGKRYEVRYRKPDGSTTRKRGFTRKKDAEAWAAKNTTDIHAGRYIDPTRSRITVGELYETWIAAKKLRVKPSYLDDLEGAWRKYVAPEWEYAPVAGVTRENVQQWVMRVSETKSASVVIRAYGVLAGILDDAVADDRIPTNKARGVVLPKKQRSKHVYLTAGQLMSLAGECRTPEHATMVLVFGTVGLRWGETTGLYIKDIDFARHRINVTRSVTQVGSRIVVGTPKGGVARSVVFPSLLDDPLHELCEGRSGDDLLFHDPSHEDGHYRYVDGPTKRQNWFSSACDRAGVPRMRVHELRHTAASLMVKSGANVKAVQRQLGHTSAAMTLDIYADLFDDDLDAVGRAMSDLLLRESVSKTCPNSDVLAA